MRARSAVSSRSRLRLLLLLTAASFVAAALSPRVARADVPVGWSLQSAVDGGTSALGSSVATTDTLAVVGAPFAATASGGKAAGAVYVYSRAGGAWTAQQLAAPTPVSGGNFGTAVAISGSLVAIGAPGTPPQAYVFASGAGAGAYTSQHAWADPKSDGNQSFGGSVAVFQGDAGTSYVAVAAPPGGASGAVYVSRQVDGGAWSDPPTALTDSTADAFGIAVAFTSDGRLLVGDPGTGAGQVLVYVAGADGSWTSQGTLPVSLDGGTVQQFGTAIAAGDGLVVVTAPGTSDGAGSYNGAAFVFAASDAGAWVQQAALTGAKAESLGNFVPAVQGGLVAVGSAINTSTSGSGQVDVWAASGGTWVAVPSSALVGDSYYGQAVGLVSGTLFVGDTNALGAASVAAVKSSLFIEQATYADGGGPSEGDAGAGGADAATSPDGGVLDAAAGGGHTDAGEGGEGSGSSSHGGCSCATTGGDAGPGALAALALGVVAFAGRTRRVTARSSGSSRPRRRR